MRIVSLVPSVTETLLDWGITPIAVTRFCEQPGLPTVKGTKDPDIEAIVSLDPDLVVVDREENRREDHDALVAAGLSVHVLAIRDLVDVDPAMTELSSLVGGTWPAGELSGQLATGQLATGQLATGRLAAGQTVAGTPEGQMRRAFVPIWRRPWMALGTPTYGASLLARLGIVSVHADHGPYPGTTLEAVRRCRPDLVVAPSEPYPFTARQLPELEPIAPTVLVDGKDLFWWGARTAGALDRLAQALAQAPA